MLNRIALVVLVVLLASAAPGFAQASHHDACGPNAAAKIADVLLVRPVALGVATATSGLWAGLSPYLMLIGVADSWGHHLVVRPWQFTGGRHAGCFLGRDAYQR